MNDEPNIRLRPRRVKAQRRDESKTWSHAFQRLMRVVRMTAKLKAGTDRQSNRSRSVRSRPAHQQRCAVRLTYSANRIRGQWGAHGRYLLRESAALPGRPSATGFTNKAEAVDLARLLNEWQKAGDPRLFKLIISPEFGDRVDLKAHTRALLARMESDIGTKLEWAAVAHFNTGHPHVHVAIRGMAEGQNLRFEREFIQHGIRRHAEALCTAQLGYRTTADAQESLRREVDQPRLTSIDRMIRRAGVSRSGNATTFAVDVHLNGLVPPTVQQFVIARLRVLITLGLAAPHSPDSWSVRSDFEAALRAMQRMTDRQRMLAAHAALLSDPRLPVQLTHARALARLDGRVIAHSLDDTSGRTFLILEGTDAKVHLIPYTDEIERARSSGILSVNHFIQLRATEGSRRLQLRDLGDAEEYVQRLQTTSVAQENSPSVWAGWLGRYLSRQGSPRTKARQVSK